MKKFFIAASLSACMLTAAAEGYQVNTLSAKQNGMGHTGTALKLGAESMIFNPGALGFLDKTLDLTGSFSAVFPSASATLPDGTVCDTSNDPSTPLSFGAAFSIYKNLKAGVSFYTPYGSGINWTDNWAGAVLNQSVKLAAYTVQPTISWRITKKLSVGAGMTITWGSVNLNKGLVSSSSMDMVLAASGSEYRFGSTTPASVNLKGKANVALGVNVGVLYDLTDNISLGASWRSKVGLKVESGDVKVSYANAIAQNLLQQRLDLINSANFTAEMPAPYVFNVGISYRPIQKLTLAFDAQLTGWNAYKTLDIDFMNDQLDAFDQHLTKDYHNSWTYHIGAQYALTNRLDLRAGMMIDTTPVNYEHYNPETPGMTKLSPSVGFSFRPIKSVSIDVAMLYVAGLGADNAVGQYQDFLLSREVEFTADYSVHAFTPSIGVSYSF